MVRCKQFNALRNRPAKRRQMPRLRRHHAIRRLTQQQRLRIADARAKRLALQKASATTSCLGPEQRGLVLANYGVTAIVEDDQQRLYRCVTRQHLGVLVSGDWVIWQASSTHEGVVIAVEPRRSVCTRLDFQGRPKPFAANLDQVLIVIAPYPEPSELLIDRYLIAILRWALRPLLVINKIDLLDTQARTALMERLAIYSRLGYSLIAASTFAENGLAKLRTALAGHTSILVGQSGVGKSSLVKALIPELPDHAIRIQALSAHGHGVHTTTTTMLYHLPDGGNLIDSPGVRHFALEPLTPLDLERGFAEIAAVSSQCRFNNCSHTVEPGCAVLKAVEQGQIDMRRLHSYRQLQCS